MSKEIVMTDEEIERELSWLRLKYPNVCFRDGDFYNGDKIVWLGWNKKDREILDKLLESNRKIYPNLIYIGGNFYKEPFKIENKNGKFFSNGVRVWPMEDNPIPVTVKSNSLTFEEEKAWLDKINSWVKDDRFYEEKLRELKEKYGIKD